MGDFRSVCRRRPLGFTLAPWSSPLTPHFSRTTLSQFPKIRDGSCLVEFSGWPGTCPGRPAMAIPATAILPGNQPPVLLSRQFHRKHRRRGGRPDCRCRCHGPWRSGWWNCCHGGLLRRVRTPRSLLLRGPELMFQPAGRCKLYGFPSLLIRATVKVCVPAPWAGTCSHGT